MKNKLKKLMVSANCIYNPEENYSADDGHNQTPKVESGESASTQQAHNDAANKGAYDTDNDISHRSHPAVISRNFAGNPTCHCTNDQPAYNPQ